MKVETVIRDQYIPVFMAQNDKSWLHKAGTVFICAQHLIYESSSVPFCRWMNGQIDEWEWDIPELHAVYYSVTLTLGQTEGPLSIAQSGFFSLRLTVKVP